MSHQDAPLIVIVGAGPGLGGSVARRFGREGYDVALIARDEAALTELGESLQAEGITTGWSVVDVTSTPDLTAAVRRFGARNDRIDVLHVNPSAFREVDAMELTVDDLLADVRLGVGALLSAVQAARPSMTAGGRITTTGSMAADKPWHRAATLGVQKAGLRNLVRSLDAALSPEGIRAVSITVNGTLSREGTFTPDRVADAIFAAASRGDAEWTDEVPYP